MPLKKVDSVMNSLGMQLISKNVKVAELYENIYYIGTTSLVRMSRL